jgi:hypothetical protein
MRKKILPFGGAAYPPSTEAVIECGTVTPEMKSISDCNEKHVTF